MSDEQEAARWLPAGDDPPERGLTEPLGNVVWAFLCFVVAGLVAAPIIALTDRQFTIYGFGHRGVCADVAQNGLDIRSSGSTVANVRAGASSFADSLQLCANHPTLGQRFLVTLTQLPTLILYLAVLVLLWLLVLTVRRHGPFTMSVSRRLRFLAWFILGGTLAVSGGESAARAAFAGTEVAGFGASFTDSANTVLSNAFNGVLTNLFPLLLVVCGLLTLARVVRRGTQMRDDLAGTV